MSKSLVISTALCLPAPEIEALLHGRLIVAKLNKFINPGRIFALYPTSALIKTLTVERYYHSNFLPIAKKYFAPVVNEKLEIQSWGRCELCQIINDDKCLSALSKLTIWTEEALQEIISQRQNIFLAYLRVYQLHEPLEIIPIKSNSQFLALPQSITVSETNPILDDYTFNQRKRQLEKLAPPLHPELEELQSAIATLAQDNPAAAELDKDIKIFLGWSSNKDATRLDSDLVWIKQIAEIGNSSDGHKFEKLVRKGLLKLGFTGSGLNPNSTGGAGGMDFYCESPYPMVGECKATKSEKVPDGTAAQLMKIGMNHLGKARYERAIKLIVAAGELTTYALKTATANEMNVIRPETLQKLVKLQAHYKNSINLLELKKCLQHTPYGLADEKVNNYIDQVKQKIRLRSHLVGLVKNYLQNAGIEAAGVEALHGVYFGSQPPQPLKSKEMHEILIELSSPLTGYLGRIKAEDWKSDRFYFLRDLQIDS
jgi:hypothetical protein